MKMSRLEEAIYAAGFAEYFARQHSYGARGMPIVQWETGCAIAAGDYAQDLVALHRKINRRRR